MKENEWFTETGLESGTSFGLKIQKKLHEEQTSFQNISIYETETFGRLMTIDGFIMLTQRDNFIYHEMMSHPVLFNHANPRHVVIVGGGDCGTLREVSKHSEVETITQIEIDERVTRLSEQYFPELCTANSDPRATFIFNDAIAWMAQAENNSVDIIIVDSTDPIGPAKGLFAEPFYQQCLRVLRADGLIVQQSESPLLHFKSITLPMRLSMQAAGFNAVDTLFFPQPTYPSGWWSATMASAQNNISLVRDQSAHNPEFETDYYSDNIHLAAFQAPSFIKKIIQQNER